MSWTIGTLSTQQQDTKMPTKPKRKVSAASKARAAARLKALDSQAAEKKQNIKRAQLRSQARMGSAAVRKKAATALSNMPRKKPKKGSK